MFAGWTFGKRLGVGFATAALTLLLVAGFGYRGAYQLIENDRWVSHTYQVRKDLADLLSQLKDAETGQRGFVITGNEAFLEPYTSGMAEVEKTLEDLKRLTSDNPQQQERLALLTPVLEIRRGELARTIAQRRTEGFEPVAKFIALGEGKKHMDKIRGDVAELDRVEAELLARRRAEAEESANTAKAVILWGSSIGVLFVGFVGLVISGSLSKQVGAAVRHVQSSSAELQAAANQQASGAKETATAMSEITTTISELMATSRQIADSAERVARICEQAAGAAREGDGTVLRGNDVAGGLRRQVDLIVSHMLELGKKSQQIGSVLEIVSELAEQTNILAINATIEAAGAGDAGRRFAVVADEIRKLADRVGGSTKEIRGLIEDVRSAVNTTVMTTETGSKAADAVTKHFSEVAAAFTQISRQVATTTEAAREIGLSTKQQATAVEQVNVAVTSVAQAARETAASTGQTLQTAQQLFSLSRDLIGIVEPQRIEARPA
ncbi:MAG TPA: CHASE3 domain-containing protein [Polyangiaceae bacterium]|nr:CHASE3 domain-containing protein [Polyangiaceae bacterium]